MSENVNVIPQTSNVEEASKAQIDLLKSYGMYREGMTRAEASDAIDRLTKLSLPPGLHKCKVKSVDRYTDDKGNEKRDSRGYPGLLITVKAQDKNDIDPTTKKPKVKFANGVFYYSPLPLDHPDRKNPEKKCRSEFNLANLKKAWGFGQEAIEMEKLKDVIFWAGIKKIIFTNDDGEVIKNEDGTEKSITTLNMKFFPYVSDETRPSIEGDPLNTGKEPSGDFIEIRKSRQKQQSKSSEAVPSSANGDGAAPEVRDVDDF